MNTSARERTERRLAAILAADIAGYSRLIGADEEGTLSRIRLIRADIIDPAIAAHRGRLVKTTGDGLLIEFASVVEALRCAVDIQHQMADRSAGVPSNERIEYRIGIHQGDVVVEDGDIFGDGVNIAARLEALADPDECRRMQPVGSTSRSRIWATGNSRTSPDLCGFIGKWEGDRCARMPASRPRFKQDRSFLTSRQSRCCRSKT